MAARVASSDTEYWIDADDRLVWVSDSWVDFAIVNEAPAFAEHRVLGEPLWRFIDGAELKTLYRGVVDRVRSCKSLISIPFRCDAPDQAREMVLHMTAQPTGGVRFVAEVLKEAERPAVPVLDARVPRSDETLVICSQCKKLRMEDGVWEDLEHAARALGLMTLEVVPKLSHGLCGPCADAFSERGEQN